MNDIHTCVERFTSLLTTEYVITLGRKNTAVTLLLSFDKEDCFHLMGLQHLKDLPNLKKNRAKIFDDIVEYRIKDETIEGSDFYHEIEERVRLLSYKVKRNLEIGEEVELYRNPHYVDDENS